MGAFAIHQAKTVEGHNQDGAKDVEHNETCGFILVAEAQVVGDGPVDDQEPEDQPHKEQNLP
jgi:hypothetical protein